MYRLLWAVVFVLDFFPHSCFAAEVMFMCKTEVAASTIASAIVQGREVLVDDNCYYLAEEVHVDIDYLGDVYGDHFRVQVVGFDYLGERRFGIMPVNEDQPVKKEDA